MIPHWITLPLLSLFVLLATATSVFAVEGQSFECTTYLQEKNAKELKECGTMTFETKNKDRESYVYTNCGNIMVRFTTSEPGATLPISHVQLLKLTQQELKLAQDKRDIKEPKILTDLIVPEDFLPKMFALSHRDEARTMTTSCHKL